MSHHYTINTNKLIAAVKKRPAIYDKENIEYSRVKKPELWIEIQKELLPNWNNLKPQERLSFGHDVRKRWKNLRTCFGREVYLQAQEKINRDKNITNKPRKIYGHFNKLRFLLPHVNNYGCNENDFKGDSNEESDSNGSENEREFGAELLELKPAKRRYSEMAIAFEDVRSFNNEYDKIELVPTASNNEVVDFKTDQNQDEDKQFLLSLLSTFQKFDDKQRLNAKIEILKVLRDISFNDDS